MHRSFIYFIVSLFSILLLNQPMALMAQETPANINVPTDSPIVRPERRGVWMTNIDSDVLFKPEKLKVAVNTLADLKFNAIYPVVWNFGYTFYPSAIAQRETGYKQAPELKSREIGRASCRERV